VQPITGHGSQCTQGGQTLIVSGLMTVVHHFAPDDRR
jgi:hypothetical protein